MNTWLDLANNLKLFFFFSKIVKTWEALWDRNLEKICFLPAWSPLKRYFDLEKKNKLTLVRKNALKIFLRALTLKNETLFLNSFCGVFISDQLSH